jgi:rhodanese-related sulfurtransferase
MTNPNRAAASVSTLDREQLRAKIAAGQPFKLAMAASDFGFQSKHIPGSIHVNSHGDTFAALGKTDDIVVYCSNIDCNASRATIKKLLESGFTKVSHYPGGLIDWEAAGLPLEGDWADEPAKPAG